MYTPAEPKGLDKDIMPFSVLEKIDHFPWLGSQELILRAIKTLVRVTTKLLTNIIQSSCFNINDDFSILPWASKSLWTSPS